MEETYVANRGRNNLTTIVTLVAIIFFVAIGAPIVGQAIRGVLHGQSTLDSVSGIAVLLNLALIMFGWRRSKGLSAERAARDAAEKRAEIAAYQDYLTGLFNRRGFSRRLESEIAKDQPLALAILDLDHFKRVNDAHGHEAGDALLRKVAELLNRVAPDGSAVGRLGGDEFAILFAGPSAREGSVSAVADEIIHQLKTPVAMDNLQAQIRVSIGLTRSDSDPPAASDLLRRADIAMYEAKKLGRNQHAWFDPSFEVELQSRQKLEAEIREGIPAGQFVPYYQPQMNLITGELHGFEVLARWNHPGGELIEPLDFIPLAETNGLIGALSLSVMRQALAETANWDHDLLIAVNLSPVQLKDPMLAQRIMKILAETGFPPKRLELEITESSLFDDLDLALSTIHSLKNLGVTISLDDLGTGYSSLTQLQALPFDRIKIDRSFVQTMADNEESAAIVSAIASLGESLNLPVTAEGVESELLQKSLEALGCSEGQGWHFGRPLPAIEIKKMLDVARAVSTDGVSVRSGPTVKSDAAEVPQGHERGNQTRCSRRSA